MNYNNSPPVTATSAHPMYPNPVYTQSPFSPVSSPVSYNGSTQEFPGGGPPSPYLTRQPSSATQLSRQPSNVAMRGPYEADTNYVDLSRSSVTPFQAVQYAEISNRLGTPVPSGLDTPSIATMAAAKTQDLPPVPVDNDHEGPFADPVLNPVKVARTNSGAVSITEVASPSTRSRAFSTDTNTDTLAAPTRPSMDSALASQDLHEFPAPPSPAIHSPTSSRINSIPPTLPEIFIGSSSTIDGNSTMGSPTRVVSYDFPASVRGSGGFGYPSGLSAAGHAVGVQEVVTSSPSLSHFRFPATPSPLASSFGMPTPPAGAKSFIEGQDAPPVPGVVAESKNVPIATVVDKAQKRPETVYDDADAYGGI